jgi:hypothetical protein
MSITRTGTQIDPTEITVSRKRCRALTTRARRCCRRALPNKSWCWTHIGAGVSLVPDDTVPDYCAISLNGESLRRATKGFFDVTGAPGVEIRIRHDGEVVWVHTGKANVRICGIRSDVVVIDDREQSP